MRSYLHPCGTGCARRSPGLLVPWCPGVLPSAEGFVLVSLGGCQFHPFPRSEGGEEEGCAGNAASGQRAPLPLCCAALRGCRILPASLAPGSGSAHLGACYSCSARPSVLPPKTGHGSHFRLKQESVTKDIRRLKQEWGGWT